MNRLVVLLGGARAGKSRVAQQMAERHGGPVVFIATAEAGDDDMAARIDAHRAERPPAWSTVEAPRDLDAALDATPSDACVIIDCLTLWTSNMMLAGHDDEAIGAAARRAAARAVERTGATIVVSNEVGLGIVPANALSRRYRDTHGRVNQAWCAAAGRAYLVVAGRVMALQAPYELQP